jgi:hypothetical protein
MFMPSSHYWNVVYGAAPGDALRDSEGVQVMGVLGKNMAWLLKAVADGKGKTPLPEKEAKVVLNYIR